MSKSIKLDSDLWRRIEEQAAKSGYSSPQEFVEHAIEKELSRLEQPPAADEVGRRLKGLGYLE